MHGGCTIIIIYMYISTSLNKHESRLVIYAYRFIPLKNVRCCSSIYFVFDKNRCIIMGCSV